MSQKLALALRYRADEAFQTSDTMLRIAETLHKQGNAREAARLRAEARDKRNESVLLMDQARVVERSASNVLQFNKNEKAANGDEEDKSPNRVKSRLFRIG
ncbi:MAG: hypothetical protein ABJC10_09925 [Acidobacteriota bacterium]